MMLILQPHDRASAGECSINCHVCFRGTSQMASAAKFLRLKKDSSFQKLTNISWLVPLPLLLLKRALLQLGMGPTCSIYSDQILVRRKHFKLLLCIHICSCTYLKKDIK